LELELPGLVEQYSYEFVPFKDAPYTTVLNTFGNPATIAKWPLAPHFKLPPSDIALLESDPGLRQRWTEFVVHSLLPPARRMADLYFTQVRSCPQSCAAPVSKSVGFAGGVHFCTYFAHNIVSAYGRIRSFI
jgi:hypothetical protein